LLLPGINRSDLRTSLGSFTGTATGVPVTVNIELTALSSNCGPLANHVVYLYSADQDYRYSGVDSPIQNQNYLRGYQVTNSQGRVTFVTTFPGLGGTQFPHYHFVIFVNPAFVNPAFGSADHSQASFNSEIILPKAASQLVYATSGYETSLARVWNWEASTDYTSRIALLADTVTGDTTSGFVVTKRIVLNV
jgi:hypothetical protein